MGKVVGWVIIHGSEVSSYDLPLWYVDKVTETNLGSVVIVENHKERF